MSIVIFFVTESTLDTTVGCPCTICIYACNAAEMGFDVGSSFHEALRSLDWQTCKTVVLLDA